MKANPNYKNIYIDIKKYTMNREPHSKRFICSICLNKQSKCPICVDKKSNKHTLQGTKAIQTDDNEVVNIYTSKQTKCIQTDDANITLLNEVLRTFQSKKKKDVSTNTYRNLAVSPVFNVSIDSIDSVVAEDKNSIQNISKHKSSSIPRMKVEELKYFLKEKNQSKNVVQEVNRMFANVKTINSDYTETKNTDNRPLTRNGPRVLPVVKTNQPGDRNGNTEECVYYCCHYQRYRCENCYHEYKY